MTSYSQTVQFIAIASILHLVLSDGYPKETPGQPFITSNAAGGESPQHDQIPAKAKALWYGSGASAYGGGSGHGGSNSGSIGSSHSQAGVAAPWAVNTRYSGPLAVTVVLPSGYLADTPDIAAARTAHLNALLQAQADAAAWKAKDWKEWQ
ncbi:hypothetical protein J6590_000934 [Homalodisca vitripennis]|nr:hypothetical protein J6590_000934 [Homalodisca vitripennis]